MIAYTPIKLLEEVVAIDIIGAGGNGSEFLDGIARMHLALTAIGHPGFHVRLWDDDTVSQTNVLRQRFLPGEVGQNKASVLINKYNLYFGLAWQAIPARFDPGCREHKVDCDLLVTCVDKAQVRVDIHRAYKGSWSRQFYWLDMGNDSNSGQVVLGHLGKSKGKDLVSLPTVLDLYPEMAEQASAMDSDGPSCSAEEALTKQEFPVNRQVATVAYTLVWNMLRHGKLDYHGAFINTLQGVTSPLRIDPAIWAGFGVTLDDLAGGD